MSLSGVSQEVPDVPVAPWRWGEEESSALRGRREQNGEKRRTEERGVRMVMLLSVVKKETPLKGRKMLAAGEM